MKLLQRITSWFAKIRKPEKDNLPVKVEPPAEIPVVPIFERFAPRQCPEYSGLNEDLHIYGMTAPDGCLWLLKDYNQAGRPVVEVRVNEAILNLRIDVLESTAQTRFKSNVARACVTEWLMRHGRTEELDDPAFGYHF